MKHVYVTVIYIFTVRTGVVSGTCASSLGGEVGVLTSSRCASGFELL